MYKEHIFRALKCIAIRYIHICIVYIYIIDELSEICAQISAKFATHNLTFACYFQKLTHIQTLLWRRFDCLSTKYIYVCICFCRYVVENIFLEGRTHSRSANSSNCRQASTNSCPKPTLSRSYNVVI